MPNITEVTISRVLSDHQYGNRQITVRASICEGESVVDVIETTRNRIDQQLQNWLEDSEKAEQERMKKLYGNDPFSVGTLDTDPDDSEHEVGEDYCPECRNALGYCVCSSGEPE